MVRSKQRFDAIIDTFPNARVGPAAVGSMDRENDEKGKELDFETVDNCWSTCFIGLIVTFLGANKESIR